VIRCALLSVSDKTGVAEFARGLAGLGVRILSTGGTASLLGQQGIPVTEVARHTGFPEMLDGRVKTLHPKIHGGILARRELPAHMEAIRKAEIDPIDLVAVNLYPFEATVADPQCRLEDAVENIDIGGPAMLRSAAKNHASVCVVVDPADYAAVLEELRASGSISAQLRFALAAKAFAHTARYDGAIANYLTSLDARQQRGEYPQVLTLQFERVQQMRYGENPHQSAAFYRDSAPAAGTLAHWRQVQGKELSYNNVADADAAWECVKTFDEPACVIVKHANPCGVAIAPRLLEAYRKALTTDPTSAFGGILAFNRALDRATADALAAQFAEVVIAPRIEADAKQSLAARANVRVLEVPIAPGANARDFKRVGGGLLVQSTDAKKLDRSEARVVTKKSPTEAQWNDLLFAWRVAKFVKSNAIVFCRDGATVGVGAGQMSRVDSARIASIKAQNAGLAIGGSVVASDAFFPFRDGLDVVVDAGAVAVIQPGGSMRDAELIAAADERGVAMVFTGVRHFRH
jgi:phosphoribosylaminoimidazolecarboxamide formyltransferase/IMP cyclohydrolase